MISFFGLGKQYASIREEILDASDQVYRSGQVLDGVYTKLFETAIASRCNRAYGIAVNSGTQALVFAQIAALKSNPGRVLIPTVSFVATINSVLMNQSTPVYCDIDFKGLMDLRSCNFKIDQTVDAVMYVNLFGNCVDWDQFQIQTQFFNDGLTIIEDAAQSFGAKYKDIPSGKMGHVSVLSFDPTKNLPNYGSGGMVLTDDYHIANTILNLRNNGKGSMLYDAPATNSKMSEADCAQMMVKLNYFDAWQRRRTAIAEYYVAQLYQYVDILTPNEHVTHAWHKFVLRTDGRDSLLRHLTHHGIETKIHYENALYDYGVGYQYTDPNNLYLETAAFTRECVSLPIYPELTDAEVEHVAQRIKQYYTDL
jgi:dTDP-4-amino-4,6-dideoxygalactose transaminase